MTPSQFKVLSDSLLYPNTPVTDNMVQMLRNKFNHFMKVWRGWHRVMDVALLPREQHQRLQ